MPIETIYPLLSSYFSNPIGLLGLLALIPLAIFYLVKREPEEQMMPSLMFFHDDEEVSSTKSSFRKVMRNLLLLLHILAIFGFAAAFAEPYIEGAGTPEHSILVMDRSASMSGDLGETKSFLRDNLGEKNTVILVDDEARTVAENIPSGQAGSIIENADLRDTGTDIAAGLQRAQRIDGKVFVGSDLDQTADNTDLEGIFSNFRSTGRSYETMDLEPRNSWGVVDMDVGRDNTTVEVKNFESGENTVTVSKGSEQRELTIEGKTVESVTFSSSTGRNTVELEEDGFEKDNTARFFVPESQDFRVTFISDEENRFLMKAFELVEFTDIEYRKPPIDGELDADMYIVGEAESMLSETAEEIQGQVEDGGNLVLFGTQDFEELGFEGLPVEDQGSYRNASVAVSSPVQISLGRTEIREVERTRGERLTPGNNALVRSDYGNGEILFYNIPDSDFNQEFMYPVFWQEISNEMLDRRPVEDLNYETGQELDEETIVSPEGTETSGRTVLRHQGFYETSRGPVAVNMLDQDESLRDGAEVEEATSGPGNSQASVQHLVILLLLGMIIAETGYLYRIGDIR